MGGPRAKVKCTECGEWVTVEKADDTVNCSCGNRLVVTITSLPAA